MAESVSEQVARHVEEHFEETVSLLADYLSYPAISCEEERSADVRRLASRIRDDLDAMGLQDARVLELEGALPMVVAERRVDPSRPTVLVYGHLDLQPVELENWDSDPHLATRRGDRLYARGAADDMGGWVSHLAAIQSWLEVAGELPCNIRLVIEGEEEIGSPNLERFMDAFPEVFVADVMVLTDCENPSTEVPGLTVSLRGLMEAELHCEALEADVHSGLWGNMLPDVSVALSQLISRLVDESGRLKVLPAEVDPGWAEASWEIPLSEQVLREGGHLLPEVSPLPAGERSPAEWLWRQPSLTVVATTLPSPETKKNALRTAASATLSIRLGPGQSPEDMWEALEACLLRDPPGGVRVSLRRGSWSGRGWLYEPSGPAFEAADRAYLRSWGHPLVQIGVGGSIPFVAIFGERFGSLPLILNGVMDPLTTAHGPNESLHLGIFRKAMLANVYLYEELGRLGLGEDGALQQPE